MPSRRTTTDERPNSLDSSSPLPPSLCWRHQRLSIGMHIHLFLIVLSFITALIILSEILLSYPQILISFLLPDASWTQLELLTINLETTEWHMHILASALACSAFVYLWYKLFILAFKSTLRLRNFFGVGHRGHSPGSSVSVESLNADNSVRNYTFCCICPMRSRHEDLRAYVSFLLLVIIMNDSIYNRPRELPLSSFSAHALLPALPFPWLVHSHFFECLSAILPNTVIRLISMARRTFFISAAEVSILHFILNTMSHHCLSPFLESSARLENRPFETSTDLPAASLTGGLDESVQPGKNSELNTPESIESKSDLGQAFYTSSSDGLPRYIISASTCVHCTESSRLDVLPWVCEPNTFSLCCRCMHFEAQGAQGR
ncbi:hypothetical protein F5890DRAFT_437307 [Lentinula detonsa]|uniref:Uncharacterized protein n=1 Tax=Lentinula detonsa TaxID=2804962 RepID=A0AA38PU82_9AGAR|nr:hypothetical protein F5890DRAFT_437307 [Lentinula detonsa]